MASNLSQASSPVADMSQFTLSMWFNVPHFEPNEFNDNRFKLLEWGEDTGLYPGGAGGDDVTTFAPSGERSVIYVATSADQFRLGFVIQGRKNSIKHVGISPGVGENTYVPEGGVDDPDANTWYLTPYAFGYIDGVFEYDKTFHLLLAVDLSAAASLTATPYPNLPPDWTGDPNYYAHFQALMVVNGVGRSLVMRAPTQSNNFSAAGPNPGETVPAWPSSLSGFSVGLPYLTQQPSPYDFLPPIKMADVQMFADKYIDPTNSLNFEQFVNIVPGGGYAQPPSIAAEAFGAQTYLFTGGTSTFFDNKGTGGSFVRSGVINDIAGLNY